MLSASVWVLAFGLGLGCGGGGDTQTCAASDPACIQRNAADFPNNPVHETGREFHALRLGDDQCNIRQAGDHLGNPISAGGFPTMLDASGTHAILQLSECVPFQFFMNFCNYGVARTNQLQDVWALSSAFQTFASNPITIKALDPCECTDATVPVAPLPSLQYRLESLNHPGGSFPLPFNFSVPATQGGLVTCF